MVVAIKYHIGLILAKINIWENFGENGYNKKKTMKNCLTYGSELEMQLECK